MTSPSGRSFITCPMQPRRSPPCNSSSVTNAPRRNAAPGTSGNSGSVRPCSAASMAPRASVSNAARSAAERSGSAMVLLAAPDRERAVQLLVHDHARQLMWQRQRAQAPDLLGAFYDVLRQPVGIADHERHVAPFHVPAAGEIGELLRGPCLTVLR